MPRKTTAPVGIELYKGKTPKWRIGKELGNGACASVHALEEIDGTPTEWAIKVAPIPTKKTKKANSMEEVNDRLLYYEHVMYQNQFQDIQGIFVPRLPPYRGPQTSGEAEGKDNYSAQFLQYQRGKSHICHSFFDSILLVRLSILGHGTNGMPFV